MPYKSLRQERYFNANRAKLEAQGVDVDEWNAASRGMRLPMRARKHMTLKQGVAAMRRMRKGHGKDQEL